MLKQVLSDALEQPPTTIQAMAEVMPTVNDYLKIIKQLSALSQLILNLKKRNAPA